MFCPKCGTPVDDNAAVCPKCGMPFQSNQPPQPQQPPQQQVPPQYVPPQQQPPQYAPPQQQAPQQPQQPLPEKVKQFLSATGNSTTIGGFTIPLGRNQLIALAGAVAAVIILLAVVIPALGGGGGGVGGGGAAGTAEKLINAIFKGDANTVVNLMPKKVLDEVCDKLDVDKKEFTEDLKDTLQDMLDDLKDDYGKFTVKTEVTKDKELKRSDVNSLADKYERYLDIDLDIDEAHEVTVKTTVKYGKEEESKKLTITTIKVKGKWYVDYYSMNSII